MDSNMNTQHTLLCITSSTRFVELLNNNSRQHHAAAVALDMSKAFHTVKKNKPILTNITNIIKFIANYFRITSLHSINGTLSKFKKINIWNITSWTLVSNIIKDYPTPKRHTNLNIC